MLVHGNAVSCDTLLVLDMEQHGSERHDELETIDRTRSQIALGSFLGLAILVVSFALLGPPERAVVIVIILVLPPLIGAIVKYRELGKQKASLLSGHESGDGSRTD